MVVVYFLVAVLVGVVALYRRWTNRHLWTLAAKLPGPRTLPIIGNALSFHGELKETFQNLLRFFKQYGPVVRLWLGPRLYVFLKDPQDIQYVLGNMRLHNRDTNFSRAMKPFFGNGLLSNRNEVWKVHRKIITPTFHFKILETYVEIFGQKAGILVDLLEAKADGNNFDVYSHLSLCTLDAICETAIGSASDTQVLGESEFKDLLVRGTALVHNRASKPWLLWDWLYPWTPDGREAQPLIKKIEAFTDDVLTRKLAAHRRGVRREGIVTATGKEVNAFLDMLIEASEAQGSVLSAQEMRDEVTTMAAAGLETTATIMSFFLELIAIHQDVQDNIQHELQGIFGDDARAATCDDLSSMEYTHRVIKEVLRLFPVVSLLPRDLSEDVRLPSGYTLPQDSAAVVLAYEVHRDPRYFPDPERFWPDRWLPENCKSLHPFAYIPFSAGQRNCVGQKYAMLQMKSILSAILRRFKVTTDYKMATLLDLEISITISLIPGYKIQLEARENINTH